MNKTLTFQEIIFKLQNYWGKFGCVIQQPMDIEVGAGTFHPATFFRALGPDKFAGAYVQPCRRPKDGRFGENPNRFQKYYQFQVIIKPTPDNIQELYLKSLGALGLSIKEHDIRYLEDDWKSPTLGAWGLGWEVWLDGQEISQFTYFQQVGGISLDVISVEITYGLERLAMYIQDIDSIHDITWVKSKDREIKYKEIHLREEIEFSEYNFHAASKDFLFNLFKLYEEELNRLLEKDLLYPAYEYTLKLSHVFNILDARKTIAVFERANLINKVRHYANTCARKYLEQFKEKNKCK